MENRPVTRILFMGTPQFSASILAALHGQAAARHWAVAAVVTQPDRRAGRGKRAAVSPVKAFALERDIPVLQPASLRKAPDVMAAMTALAPDLIVVAAYGLILPRAVLELPQFGAINVHASLLPAYRGASPIAAALLDGLDETGVSIMLMDAGMDTGPVLRQARLAIQTQETTESLTARLATLGAETLTETLPPWLAGDIAPVEQARLPGEPSVCRLITKQDGAIDWAASAAQIERMTRAYAPWPSAYSAWQGEIFKIIEADVVPGQAEPGYVVMTDRGPAVGTGDGLLRLQRVQPAGKRVMDVHSFINGAPHFIGGQLTSAGGTSHPVAA